MSLSILLHHFSLIPVSFFLILLFSAYYLRVNTFRRLDLLSLFLDHYSTCRNVRQIQVVWSDQNNSAPMTWLKHYPEGKVVFEVHGNDSLNNRFHHLIPIPTEVTILPSSGFFLCPCLGIVLRLLNRCTSLCKLVNISLLDSHSHSFLPFCRAPPPLHTNTLSDTVTRSDLHTHALTYINAHTCPHTSSLSIGDLQAAEVLGSQIQSHRTVPSSLSSPPNLISRFSSLFSVSLGRIVDR